MLRALTALAVLFACPAWAELQCLDYDKAASQLVERFGEQRFWTGPDANGMAVELWAAPGGGTWTLLLRPDETTACRVSDGPSWQPGAVFVPIRGTAL